MDGRFSLAKGLSESFPLSRKPTLGFEGFYAAMISPGPFPARLAGPNIDLVL